MAVVSLQLLGATGCAAVFTSISHAAEQPGAHTKSHYAAPQALETPIVDGLADDAVWEQAEWRAINHRWLGPEYAAEDFSGRFKIAWDQQRIYIMVEIVDDILFDAHRDPLVQYWDDDCLEIFVDEDFSGGNHQYNHNAFAYHMSLDNRAIDIGTDEQPRDYTSHTESHWRQHADVMIWEVAISLYPDTYQDDVPDQSPVALSIGKTIGLMIAYCDNDGSELRENFIGSEAVLTGATDRGWIDADLFGAVELVGGE
ncbi:MAG: sugar-binding protein [Pseudomonadota bacterium]